MTAGTSHFATQWAEPEDNRDESAAWMHGAAEALSVLNQRGPAARRRAAQHAVDLLARHAEPADWAAAGLPPPTTVLRCPAGEVPVSDPAVLSMARTAASLTASTLPGVEAVRVWASMGAFIRQAAPSAPKARRTQDQALAQQVEIDQVPGEVVDGLLSNYEWHRATYGHHAYLTSLARTNLARAYRRRATGTDLTDAEQLFREEIDTRTRRYGPGHPFVLVARNLLARCLLARAEQATDQEERRALALQAHAEADHVRAARDRIFGATSLNAALSRRHQGHALLILGDTESLNRARVCLRHVLDFETASNDNSEWRGSGDTHLLLARACLALGDHPAALDHARNAHRLLAAHAPAGESCRNAAALVQQLSEASGGTFHDFADISGMRSVHGEASQTID